MEKIDTVPASTVETGDTVSFVCWVEDELIAELMTVKESYESCDDKWCLDGYSLMFGEHVIRFVDPDEEIDIIGEL